MGSFRFHRLLFTRVAITIIINIIIVILIIIITTVSYVDSSSFPSINKNAKVKKSLYYTL